MSGHSIVCGILPPYILRRLAERGDADAREMAHATLDAAAYMRGERAALGTIAVSVAVAPGEKRRTIYDAHQTRVLPGTRVRSEGEPRSGDAAVNEAYEGSGKTFDYFAKVHDRISIDGRGMRLDSTVHFGNRFANAQWNGRQMIYGDGDGTLFNRFTRSLDVIAHELTHGVTQLTAGLAYHDEPGALNEHFSDVFGAMVKQYSKKQKAAEADWLIGAELFARGIRGRAVRSMKAPGSAYDDPLIGKDPQPSHMRAYVVGDDDNGGVHINSGIPNHAFYRAATLIGGYAWEVAGKIWYRALTHRLHAESSFADCARATFDTAGELFGQGSEPQAAVEAAWEGVGVATAPFVSEPRMPIRRHVAPVQIASAAAELPPMLVQPPKRAKL